MTRLLGFDLLALGWGLAFNIGVFINSTGSSPADRRMSRTAIGENLMVGKRILRVVCSDPQRQRYIRTIAIFANDKRPKPRGRRLR